MRRNLFLFLLLAIGALQTSRAQSVGYFMTDLKGEPIANAYSRVTEGSPFFNPEWLKGMAIGTDGKVYDNLTVKLNLLDPGVHYQDENMREFRLSSALKEIVLTDPSIGKSFRFMRMGTDCQGKAEAWYQVLDAGAATLLKLDTRVLTEIKPYGSATVEEHISPVIRYFLVQDGACMQVKSPAQLWELLAQKKPGFMEKPSGKTNAKKIEDELLQVMQVYQHQ